MRNLITDVPSLRVGHAPDTKLGSGVTAIVFDAAVVASVDVRGGGPGTRETALLDPAQTVEGIDAIVLSGGSAFGLDAASGVQARLREQGRGFQVRDARVPIVPVLAAATPALAIGHAIGRIGCFLVGDDYGRPTDLPWGVAFPDGRPPIDVPVHPTQLYETLSLVPLAWLLIRWRRQGVPDRVVLGRYFVLAGSIRFAIEFIRVNLRIVGPLTLAQLIALALIAVGSALALRAPRVTAGSVK